MYVINPLLTRYNKSSFSLRIPVNTYWMKKKERRRVRKRKQKTKKHNMQIYKLNVAQLAKHN